MCKLRVPRKGARESICEKPAAGAPVASEKSSTGSLPPPADEPGNGGEAEAALDCEAEAALDCEAEKELRVADADGAGGDSEAEASLECDAKKTLGTGSADGASEAEYSGIDAAPGDASGVRVA
jgi:hypothetical protein